MSRNNKIINELISSHRRLSEQIISDFNIFVWGPGKHSEYWDTRETIANRLKNKFKYVLFSEDIVLPNETREDWLKSLLYQEALHGRAADIIFILPLSVGSMFEFVTFSNVEDISQKIYPVIFNDISYNKGLLESVTLFLLKDYEQIGRISKFSIKTNPLNIAEECFSIAMASYRLMHPLGPNKT